MSRYLSLALTTAAVVLVGCAPRIYVPPTEAEPHADVTLRIIHHERSGPNLSHQTMIGPFEIHTGIAPSVGASAPTTRSVRVRPILTEWGFSTQFTHQESRMVTVYENEQYACGTQRVGYGRTARTSTRYCTRSVPRQRYQTITVTDGACETGLHFTPVVGERYVLQYDYHGHASCRARCFVRSPGGVPGRFVLTPCGARPRPSSGGHVPARRSVEAASPSRTLGDPS